MTNHNIKKICWITADYFADCDFVPIEEVAKVYEVTWIINNPQNARFDKKFFEVYQQKHPNVKVVIFESKYSKYNPLSFWEHWKWGKIALRTNADVYYVNVAAAWPTFWALWMLLPKNKLVISSHQGKVHDGFRFKTMNKIMRWSVYFRAKNVLMFSKSQMNLFIERYKYPKVSLIPLCLKDFGKPTASYVHTDSGMVNFLSFGIINYGKNIDILIEAACKLYEMGYRNFKISINGMCSNWDFYQQKIKYPEIFETDIRMVENELIPNLFTEADYFVQPYRIVTQSGPMKIAFNYNTPIICSNLPGFADEMKEGITGYMFEPENVESLVAIMKKVIDNYEVEYPIIKEKMKLYVQQNYSNEAVGEMYVKLFNSI